MHPSMKALVVLIALVCALPAFAHETCTLVLTGQQEVPANPTAEIGVAELRLTGRVLHFDITWTGLTGDFTGAHFHAAPAGANGPVVFSLVPFVEGNRARGIWVVPNEHREHLLAGGLYINVHSTTFPGGEIRAQVDCGFTGHGGQHADDVCVVRMSGSEEVPPNDSENWGIALLRLDENILHFNVYWTGVTGDFTGAHFHHAPEGTNGPVVFSLVPFVNGNSASGTWELTDDQLDLLEMDHLYVNVHSTMWPGGEIRGQVDCDFGRRGHGRPQSDQLAGTRMHSLHSNYPNPFNPETSIAFELAEAGLVKLAVYDMLGREIVSLVNQEMPQGRHSVVFNGNSLPSGIYFYRLEANGFTAQRKMLLLK